MFPLIYALAYTVLYSLPVLDSQIGRGGERAGWAMGNVASMGDINIGRNERGQTVSRKDRSRVKTVE